MANIFKQAKDINEHPNRNNFDLSRKSNVSLKFGTLYPVFTQPVVPGDSFDIQAAYNLKLNPIVFPVQTKMRAHMHFFYVRNKNLWKNWQNWISNLPGYTNAEHPHPYLNIPDNKFRSGSIHDFLGVPTTLVSNVETPIQAEYLTDNVDHNGVQQLYFSSMPTGSILGNIVSYGSGSHSFHVFKFDNYVFNNQINLPNNVVSNSVKEWLESSTSSPLLWFVGTDIDNAVYEFSQRSYDWTYSEGVLTCKDFAVALKDAVDVGKVLYLCFGTESAPVTPFVSYMPTDITSYSLMYYNTVPAGFYQYSDLNIRLYTNHLHINALPYRAYESIYNCYYRNNVVDPLIVNGTQKYNEYNTTTDDGADTTDYHLFQRNYELDFLTSALPSPQQGVAPLVGMTALGNITIEDENGITTAHAEVDNDGTISKVVLTSPAASVDHARTAMNIAASGMSINDFRNTNALQRLLETNIRKGYRYIDFIAGHFGMEPEYRELDMPEFIGGFSRDVNVSTVVSNADTLGDDSGKSLGSFGGYAQLNDGSKHNIRHYCDDYGYIIGILSVVPTPCYSQLLRKDMVAPDNFLDYYFPEFSQTGMQPIPYREVAPIQSYLDSLTDPSKSLDDTFGYQRPNYDMVAAVDEVHGDFRGSLRNYVINRIFDTRPELGHDFLAINPAEINDIFVNTNPDDDTMIGEIGFAVHAKRPVPRVVIPNLGK